MQVTTRSFWTVRNGDGIVAAIAGFVIICFFTHHSGIGVSPDSVTYISVASNIHDHGGWIDFHGDPLVDFPILYPFFLSAVQWLTRMDILRSAPLLNGLLFAATIYFFGWLIQGSAFRSKTYKWTLLALIVTSPCLLELYSMIWSETLFLLLLLSFFYVLHRYFLLRSAKILIVAGLVAGLAFITRYAGITLIGTGGLLLLCDFRAAPEQVTGSGSGSAPGKKFRRLFLFGGGACLFPVINLVHNKLAGGALIGNREKGTASFGGNLHDLGSVFCDWLHIPDHYYLLATLIGLGWIILFLAVFIMRLIRKQALTSYENISIVFFIVYGVFILASATVSRFQQLDSRLLSPLFISWLWGSMSIIEEWMASRRSAMRRTFFLPVLLAVGFLLVGQLLTDRETWEDVKDSGIPGYTDEDWRLSETIGFARGNIAIRLLPGPYSNAYDALWFLGGIHADLLPHKDSPGEIAALLARDQFYVVWFNDGLNPDLVDIAFISQYKKLAGVNKYTDGSIYFFTGK
jgi:hypothetical protein